MLAYFWRYETEIPSHLQFKEFGIAHLLWLGLLLAAGIWLFRHVPHRRLRLFLGGALFLLEATREIWLTAIGHYGIYELPLHLCSMAGLLCGVHALLGRAMCKHGYAMESHVGRDHAENSRVTEYSHVECDYSIGHQQIEAYCYIEEQLHTEENYQEGAACDSIANSSKCTFLYTSLGHILYSLGLPGAAMALLFPDWVTYPPIHFLTFHAFLFHAGIILYVITALAEREIRPSLAGVREPITFLCVVVPCIYAFDRHFHANYFFVNVPSEGSPLVLLAAWLGNPGYLVGYAVLALLLMLLMNGLYVVWSRR